MTGLRDVATTVKEKVSGVEVPVEHKKALNRRHRQDALYGYGFLAPQLHRADRCSCSAR